MRLDNHVSRIRDAAGVERVDDAAERRVRVLGQLELLSLETREEGERRLGARDVDHVGDGLHDGAVDVGRFEEGRTARFEARGDKGEADPGGFEVVEEGVRAARAADVDEGDGGFEDEGGRDVGMGLLERKEVGAVEAVVEAVGTFGDALSR